MFLILLTYNAHLNFSQSCIQVATYARESGTERTEISGTTFRIGFN